MAHRADRNGMKQGSATTEFVGVEWSRANHRRWKRANRKAAKRGPDAVRPPARIAKAAKPSSRVRPTKAPRLRATGSPQICDERPITGQQNLNKLFKGQRQQRVKARAA